MTISVHALHEEEYVQKGYVEVGRRHLVDTRDGQPFDRIDFADDSYCLHRMRPWKSADGTYEQHGYCLLDKGHKGKRHATVVHWCDGCGKARRGEGHSYSDEDVTICWFCRNIDYPRHRYDHYYAEEQADG